MQLQNAFIPNIDEITTSTEWTSVHSYLPTNAKTPWFIAISMGLV